MSHKWQFLMVVGILFSPWAAGQSVSAGGAIGTVNLAITPVADTAQLIGISSELNELHRAHHDAPGGSPEQWRILWLHQRIVERTTAVQLQIDATLAEIDNEIARATEVRVSLPIGATNV